MKIILWCLCTACFIGCLPIPQTEETDIPQLIFQSPLPVIPATIQKLPSEINLAVFILENGTVNQVRFSKSSGSNEWDSLAASTIMQWRFSPARLNNIPFSTWFHLRAPLHYANPMVLSLAEILCATEEQADSIYEALEHGDEFNVLARRYSIDTSRENRGILGAVNVYSYPEHIRHMLVGLDIGEYTKPMVYGNQYIIFKRMKKAE
jgi:TonB family protein